jgi:hypothetical protein
MHYNPDLVQRRLGIATQQHCTHPEHAGVQPKIIASVALRSSAAVPAVPGEGGDQVAACPAPAAAHAVGVPTRTAGARRTMALAITQMAGQHVRDAALAGLGLLRCLCRLCCLGAQ